VVLPAGIGTFVGHQGGATPFPSTQAQSLHFCPRLPNGFRHPEDFDLRADLGNAWRMIRATELRVAVHFEPGLRRLRQRNPLAPHTCEDWDHDTGRVTLTFMVDGPGRDRLVGAGI